MCFKLEISFTIGIIGIISSLILFYNKYYYASIGTFYFSLMEIIQGFQYFVIDKCDNQINVLLTYLGYLHICFQPFFISIWLYEFVNKKKCFDNYLKFILGICFFGGLLLLSRVFVNDKLCDTKTEHLCGKKTCSKSGIYHIIWQIRLRAAGSYWITPSIGLHFFLWVCPFIVFGLLFKNYKIILFTLVTILIPTILFYILHQYNDLKYEDTIHEVASIWCILFIPQIILTYIILFLLK